MAEKKYVPYVPSQTDMKEFTFRALFIGLILCVILGAANAYLGLRAGMTIAATYPAAVIGMAVLRLFKGSILEENIARTVGSIGESVAAGAIFTIPAFLLSGVWNDFTMKNYLVATFIMAVGGVLGILFVTVLRRAMVEDVDLPYPESVAAAEIHKAGQSEGKGASYLFGAMGIGALIFSLGKLNVFSPKFEKLLSLSQKTVNIKDAAVPVGGGATLLVAPEISPAYMGVGYIIGPQLAALNFSGGLLSWGLFVPLLMYFLGPQLAVAFGTPDWASLSIAVWKNIVRPIAIGAMLTSACFTLYKMRNSLITGLRRAVADVVKSASSSKDTDRLEKDMSFKFVAPAILLTGVATFFLFYYFCKSLIPALVATVVMVVAGFFFAAVSGYLVGIIGSSSNPISGLTISAILISGLLLVAVGMYQNPNGVAAVLGVAAVVCVAAAVAGEMLQDLKVGHILGGTPWKMQVGDLIGVLAASAVMFFPLLVLHQGDIKAGGTGFGGAALPAPQAGAMAALSQGIVQGNISWELIIIGILLASAMILTNVKSPMVVSVGMYLPFETSAAIFVGGVIRLIADSIANSRKYDGGQKLRLENNGTLIAAGLIAGEALIGLVFAALAFFDIKVFSMLANPSYLMGLPIVALVAAMLIYYPLKNAGPPAEKT